MRCCCGELSLPLLPLLRSHACSLRQPQSLNLPALPHNNRRAAQRQPNAGEAPLVLGLDPATGGMERYVGLEGKVDPGAKKVPKIYHLAVHPTR